ncbi:hypothetical protein QUF72_18630 [Desulfobacterales bacterium HSG2]|nr:hypothetical protein [Desulfobacterales bacterium HSG2]
MAKSDSPESSVDKVDELIQQAEEAMVYYEDDGDWSRFDRLRMQLEDMPYTYVFVLAGPEADKERIKDLKVDLRSVKGNNYRQFHDYMRKHHGSVLKEREICAAACLLENVHQHVKKGIGLCVIKIALGKYKKITVSDNGEGFYNYKKQKRLAVKDAIKFGKAYGSRYKSLGQALATSFGLWADFATVETPNDTVIIVPEGILKKITRGLSRIIFALLIAIGADFAVALMKEEISVIDIFIIASVFGIVMQRDMIKSAFGIKSEKEYFPQVKFRAKNKQKFGSIVSVYFCSMSNMKKWRNEATERLKISLKERAKSLRG